MQKEPTCSFIRLKNTAQKNIAHTGGAKNDVTV
jgi:hypothetical protein